MPVLKKALEGYELPANEYALVEEVKREPKLSLKIGLELQAFLGNKITSFGQNLTQLQKDILKPMAAVRGVTRIKF